jgi:multicomponent Na+:H+ antiporter subunit E
MGSKITLFLLLIALWFTLSGFFKPLFIFFGVSSVFFCLYFVSKMQKAIGEEDKKYSSPNYLSPRFIIYIMWLSKEMVKSSFSLATEMWREKPSVRPELAWIKHSMSKDEGIALYANSITLTPSTISIYTSDKEILVHAIHPDYMEDLRNFKMHDKVKAAVNDNSK